jgi:hypothetical protein
MLRHPRPRILSLMVMTGFAVCGSGAVADPITYIYTGNTLNNGDPSCTPRTSSGGPTVNIDAAVTFNLPSDYTGTAGANQITSFSITGNGYGNSVSGVPSSPNLTYFISKFDFVNGARTAWDLQANSGGSQLYTFDNTGNGCLFSCVQDNDYYSAPGSFYRTGLTATPALGHKPHPAPRFLLVPLRIAKPTMTQ